MLVLVAVAASVLFVRRQRRVASPLISPRVFADRVLARSVLVNGLVGFALYGVFTYVALVASLGLDAAGTDCC